MKGGNTWPEPTPSLPPNKKKKEEKMFDSKNLTTLWDHAVSMQYPVSLVTEEHNI